MNLHPFDDIVESAVLVLEQGGHFHQQFVCARCHAKQTMEEVDKMFYEGICEECGYTTNIKQDGCNLLAIFGHDT